MCITCGDVDHRPALTRRGFMATGGAAALGALWSKHAAAADPVTPGSPPPPNAISPAAALQRLMQGNARYAANTPNQRDFSAGRAARARGQHPIAAILSCADSRVAPEIVFDQDPGELFVVRVAGNVVSPDLLASLEYGVQFLGAPLIMVLGHSGCGAVDAAIKVVQSKVQLPGHLPDLIGAIKPAVLIASRLAPNDVLNYGIAENVRRQVARLDASPPIVQKLRREKKIDIVGGVYDIASGKVTAA